MGTIQQSFNAMLGIGALGAKSVKEEIGKARAAKLAEMDREQAAIAEKKLQENIAAAKKRVGEGEVGVKSALDELAKAPEMAFSAQGKGGYDYYKSIVDAYEGQEKNYRELLDTQFTQENIYARDEFRRAYEEQYKSAKGSMETWDAYEAETAAELQEESEGKVVWSGTKDQLEAVKAKQALEAKIATEKARRQANEERLAHYKALGLELTPGTERSILEDK